MSRLKSKLPKADFKLEKPGADAAGKSAVLSLSGHWVVTQLTGMSARINSALKGFDHVEVRSEGLQALDTAGAFILRQALEKRLVGVFATNPKYVRLFELVDVCTVDVDTYNKENPTKRHYALYPVYFALVSLGRLVSAFMRDFIAQAIFMGHVITLGLLSIVRPGRIRWPALINIMQRAGLEALPIVALTNMFVGAVLAFLMVLSLKAYGGAVFAIDFVSIGVLREFAPVIAAVLIAGRSASGFTAEIGSMKMNQEIDAMRVMGIDPYEALILPRVVALVIMTPLVTFIGSLAGLLGGALAIWGVLGLGPSFFVQRMYDYVPPVNLFVGMIRTPFFAVIIAMVGCRLGMTVKDDVISLGRQVTTSVVQSIFLIFMADAMFAMLFNGFTF